MGKFDNVILCSDLDGTMLDRNSNVSEKNSSAAKYFMSEGGKFMIVTGRTKHGAAAAVDKTNPNLPTVLFNGCGIYDYRSNKTMWGVNLDDGAKDVIRLVEKSFPKMGLVICAEKNTYCDKLNRCIESYYPMERGEATEKNYENIDESWKKVVFVVDEEDLGSVREIIAKSEFADKYSFMQSSENYYEILPKGASKASAISAMIEICGLQNHKIICVGDGENDALMLKNADVGITMSNAMEYAKDAADIVLDITNDEDVIHYIVNNII